MDQTQKEKEKLIRNSIPILSRRIVQSIIGQGYMNGYSFWEDIKKYLRNGDPDTSAQWDGLNVWSEKNLQLIITQGAGDDKVSNDELLPPLRIFPLNRIEKIAQKFYEKGLKKEAAEEAAEEADAKAEAAAEAAAAEAAVAASDKEAKAKVAAEGMEKEKVQSYVENLEKNNMVSHINVGDKVVIFDHKLDYYQPDSVEGKISKRLKDKAISEMGVKDLHLTSAIIDLIHSTTSTVDLKIKHTTKDTKHILADVPVNWILPYNDGRVCESSVGTKIKLKNLEGSADFKKYDTRDAVIIDIYRNNTPNKISVNNSGDFDGVYTLSDYNIQIVGQAAAAPSAPPAAEAPPAVEATAVAAEVKKKR